MVLAQKPFWGWHLYSEWCPTSFLAWSHQVSLENREMGQNTPSHWAQLLPKQRSGWLAAELCHSWVRPAPLTFFLQVDRSVEVWNSEFIHSLDKLIYACFLPGLGRGCQGKRHGPYCHQGIPDMIFLLKGPPKRNEEGFVHPSWTSHVLSNK